jgi:hypothetical protein
MVWITIERVGICVTSDPFVLCDFCTARNVRLDLLDVDVSCLSSDEWWMSDE